MQSFQSLQAVPRWTWLVICLALATGLASTGFAIAQDDMGKLKVPGIMVVYPKDGATIANSTTFLIGSTSPGSRLTVNGSPVWLNSHGYFAHVVPLKPGKNVFRLALGDAGGATRQLVVFRETQAPPLLPGPLKFLPDQAEPREDLGLATGDILPLAIRATPGSQVHVRIGLRTITLRPAVGKRTTRPVNRGLDAAYGKVFQRFSPVSPDLYLGFYRVQAADRWREVHPRYLITRGKKAVSWLSPVKLSTVEQPIPAETVNDDTVVRLGPGQARTTPLPRGVRLLIDGWQGDAMRCAVSPGRHLWIVKQDLTRQDVPPAVPTSLVRTVNILPEPGGVRIAIPLSERLPYQIEQNLNPNRLILRIFGANADTDWITQTPQAAAAGLVDHVTWRQGQDRCYELTAYLTVKRQWGFWASYEDTTLVLHIKGPPDTVPDSGSLAGLRICLDPGHGGQEDGSIGPSGIAEKRINLAIALKLRDLLQEQGATVTMTRTSDSENPSLTARVAAAVKAGADLLLSIHNNALPDGRDPLSEHGTSSYWYHPQSLEFARALNASVVQEVGFPDFGVFYQNLALARPSQMPAALVEVGFMINPDEYAQLIDPQVQERAARGLLDGIRRYLAGPR